MTKEQVREELSRVVPEDQVPRLPAEGDDMRRQRGGGEETFDDPLGSPVGQQTVLENQQIRPTLMTPSVF